MELKPVGPPEHVDQVVTQAGVGHVGVVDQQVERLPGVHALQSGVRALVSATDLVDPVLEVVVAELGSAVVVRCLVVGVVVQAAVEVATVRRVGVAGQLNGRRLVGETDLHRRVHLVHHRDAAALADVGLTASLDHEDAVVRLRLVGHHLPGATEVEPDGAEQVGVAVRTLLDHRRRTGDRRGLLGRSGLDDARRRGGRVRRRLGGSRRHGRRNRLGADRSGRRSRNFRTGRGVVIAYCERHDDAQQNGDDDTSHSQQYSQFLHLQTCLLLERDTAMAPLVS